jgi:hypothetical protein
MRLELGRRNEDVRVRPIVSPKAAACVLVCRDIEAAERLTDSSRLESFSKTAGHPATSTPQGFAKMALTSGPLQRHSQVTSIEF